VDTMRRALKMISKDPDVAEKIPGVSWTREKPRSCSQRSRKTHSMGYSKFHAHTSAPKDNIIYSTH
jgi:hypothetical protein